MVEVPPRLPASYGRYLKKLFQFGISVFLEVQEIIFWGTLKVNMINIAYFFVNFFVLLNIALSF